VRLRVRFGSGERVLIVSTRSPKVTLYGVLLSEGAAAFTKRMAEHDWLVSDCGDITATHGSMPGTGISWSADGKTTSATVSYSGAGGGCPVGSPASPPDT
jgi:hypothetical protein